MKINKANLSRIMEKLHPEISFDQSSDYISEGLIDSFDIVVLVAEFEKQFGISIDGEDVTPENFKNVKTIQNLLKSY